MSGNNIQIDTNIAIYLLDGDVALSEFLEGKNVYISFVTELELLGYKKHTKNSLGIIHSLIESCTIVDINSEIKKYVVTIRNNHKIKLPDAIVAATSLYLNTLLVTADKGFEKIKEINAAIYEK